MTFPWIPAIVLRPDRKYRWRGVQGVRWWCDSRRQPVDCLNHRVVKIVQPLPFQSPIERDTDISAGQPELDVIHLIDHRVLCLFHPPIAQYRPEENSL